MTLACDPTSMAEPEIAGFEDLVEAARRQPQPQRLLFVFTVAALPDEATPEQRRRFAEGAGGALVPLMYVDKTPEELGTFADLARESRAYGSDWTLVFAAGLAGRGGRAPSPEEALPHLQRMVDAIKAGTHASFIAFDRDGLPVRFE